MIRRSSEALVVTDRPARYIKQLCTHFAHEAASCPVRVRIERDEDHGVADFGWIGSCRMRADPGGLRLHVTARGRVRLRVLERMLASHLERFGRRDALVVRWHPAA